MDLTTAIAMLTAASGSVRSLAETGVSIRALLAKDEGASEELKSAISRLLDDAISAKQLSLEAIETAQLLAEELRKKISFDEVIKDYRLINLIKNVFVYKYLGSRNLMPDHFICPQCVEDRRRSILQGDEYYIQCSSCNTGYNIMADDLDYRGPIQDRDKTTGY